MTESGDQAEFDLDRTVRELSDRVAIIKAHIVGRDRVADSNVLGTDGEAGQLFAGAGVVPPPYEPETLAILYENSSSLRQNVDAYVTNIDAFGHRLEPVLDLDASDADQRIANAIYVERSRLREDPRHRDDADVKTLSLVPTAEEVAAKRRDIADHMRLERFRLENFFEYCCTDTSFSTLRRRTRQDLEVMGNGYWEVLRNGAGEIVQFVYLPAFTVRLLPLDLDLVEVETRVKVSELAVDGIKVRRRFRRFIQIHDNQSVWFKEFGDPRVLSRKTGRFFASLQELRANDAEDGPATELMHFKLHNPRSAYGTPRWIGNLLAVLGSRQAEEVNFLYFENKSVPPLALLVSGGRLSEASVPRIESFIENHIKGKRNFHKILILEAEPGKGSAENTGRIRIELRPLTSAQQQDALFMGYDQANQDKVGQSFRLPRLLRGDIRDFNRSTADAALMFAEMQVFQPEREEFDFIINRKFLAELGARFWRFRSNSPVTRDPATMAEIVRGLVNANILTPEEGRQLAGDVFNREFKRIEALWTKQPVSLTLAGVPIEPDEQSELIGPELSQAAAAPQALVPPRGARKRRRAGNDDLSLEAERLVRLRDALRAAERKQARESFAANKREELETEVVRVPPDELQSWFEPEAACG